MIFTETGGGMTRGILRARLAISYFRTLGCLARKATLFYLIGILLKGVWENLSFPEEKKIGQIMSYHPEWRDTATL